MEDLVGTSQDSDGFPPLPHEPAGRSRYLPQHWPPWAWSLLALAVGLAGTFVFVGMQNADAERKREDTLAQLVDATRAEIVDRLRQSEMVLRALQTLYVSSEDVTDREFADGYANLRVGRRFPSLQSVAFSRRVPPPGTGFVIEQHAPIEGNAVLSGLEIARQPANLEAAVRAGDTDEPALTAPFPLIQDARRPAAGPGMVLRLPVYTPGAPPLSLAERRLRLRGSLGLAFHVDTFLANSLPPAARGALRVRVQDVSSARARLLFDSRPGAAWPVRSGGPLLERRIAYGGRTWKIEAAPLQATAPLGWRDSALLPGLVASVLLALLAGVTAGSRRRALETGWRMSRRFRESEERFRTLSDLLPALVLLADRDDGRIRYANQAARLRLGQDVRGRILADVFGEDEQRGRVRVAETAGCSNAEALLCNTSGDRFWASVSIAPVELDDVPRLLMVASDISEQRQLTEMLGYQASHDALTDLVNRREFERQVEHALAGRAAGAPPCALLFLDLDQFKLINDTSGHAAGDQLLIQIANLMRDQMRAGDVLARLGGDEFGVLATQVHDVDGARLAAERLRERIDLHGFVWEGRSYAVTASIGGVMLDEAGMGLRDLFAQADTACYLAKEGGRNRVHFYCEQDDEAARRRNEMEWAHRLRWAMDAGRLLLHYQEVWPLMLDLEGGARIELLLRLREEDGRIVSPGAFIPAAERYGLMPMIDRWVIETALANFDRLHPSGAGLQLATINLSGASIEDESLADLILALIERHRVEPGRVCFEITETVAVRNLAQVTRFIERLRAVGCRIALDDFGAGMSSFGYLKSLPIDIIKIDGSFIHDLLSEPMSQAIVRAVTDIGHDRGFKVVAEWVTGHAIADRLAEIGVDYAQGFGLHRPQAVVFQRGA